jgi:cysteine desulfurase
MSVYLDNAATTALAPEVRTAMVEAMDHFGNPSSTHTFGRKARLSIEQVRKQIADSLNCAPGEIVFTSGGTEADNFALLTAVRDLGCRHIITSPIEHHAVLHTAEFLSEQFGIELHMVDVDARGRLNWSHLEQLLETHPQALVSLMHGNNEIGNLIDISRLASLCHGYGAFCHSDTVQTIGHYQVDVKAAPVDFLAASAHKFHGPKGVGFAYVKGGLRTRPLLHGGAQERGARGGTENLLGIVGMGKALESTLGNLESDQQHIRQLKSGLIHAIKTTLPQLEFFGACAESDSLDTVVNLAVPVTPQTGMLTFSLDMKGIAVSGGSACQSGSNQGSHVIRQLLAVSGETRALTPLRVSFSRYNTMADVEALVEALKTVM